MTATNKLTIFGVIMAENSDAYQTIQGDANAQFVEQRSRFLSYAYHVTDLEQVKMRMEALQKEYYDARHICYAYMLGPERLDFRANDNGEPSGTAGKPILGQINSAGLTDILIAVVRYFGGVKLGTSGLIEAYRLGAQMAIQESEIVTRYVQQDLRVLYNFDLMNEVMKIVKDLDMTIVSQEYGVFEGPDPKGGSDPLLFECSMILRNRRTSVEAAVERIKRIIEPMPEPEMSYEIACEAVERI